MQRHDRGGGDWVALKGRHPPRHKNLSLRDIFPMVRSAHPTNQGCIAVCRTIAIGRVFNSANCDAGSIGGAYFPPTNLWSDNICFATQKPRIVNAPAF